MGLRQSLLRPAGLWGGLILSAVSWSGAQAQQVDELPATAEQRIALREAQEGFPVGPFTFRPLVAAELAYDDNVYASSTNRQADALLRMEARAALTSDFSHHAANAEVFVRHRQYLSISSENVTEYGATLLGRYDIGPYSNVTLQGGFQHLAERRGDIDALVGATSPAEYDLLEGQLSAGHRFNRFGLTLETRFRNYAYADARIAGVGVDQHFRDFSVANGVLGASYDLSAGSSFVVRGELERRRYDLRLGDPDFDPAEFDRSANGERIEAGFSQKITELISATARIGYLRYSYPDQRIPTTAGLSYNIDLRWDVTPLTTVSLQALRRLDETLAPQSAGNLRDEFTLRAQHELLRTLIVNVEASYADINASGAAPDSIDYRIQSSVRWYATRNIVFEAGLLHRRRSSAADTLDFTLNQVWLGVTLRR